MQTTKKRPGRPKKHGQSIIRSRTYRTWMSMRERCNCQSSKDFKNYGRRGVWVCERWKEYNNFLADMGERPPGMSIDRIDNNIGYTPSNCRWATRLQQNRNKRTNRAVGSHPSLTEAAEIYGLRAETIRGRLRRGWSEERALITPVISRTAQTNS